MKSIGFFDSGVGGLTVLKPAVRLLPREQFIYYGDNASAPYGAKSKEEIIALTLRGAEKLTAQGIKALVLACNTATSAAAPVLRQRLNIPVIAIEPALKPAQAMRHGGRIVVLATPATLALPRFGQVMAQYGQHTLPIGLTGLVELVERGITEGPLIDSLLEAALAPALRTHVDAIVLGCTHYPLVAAAIRRIAGEFVPLIDGATGTAAQLRRIIEGLCLSEPEGVGGVCFQSSGGSDAVALMQRLYAVYDPYSIDVL